MFVFDPFRRRTRQRRDNPALGLHARDRRSLATPRLALPALPGMPAWLLPSLLVPLRLWRVGLPVALCLATWWAAFNLPAFAVERLEVRGPSGPRADAIAAAAGVTGTNLFSIDTAALANRIEAATTVRVDDIERRWPNQLTVAATERQPRAVWQAGGVRWYADIDGVILGPAPAESPLITLRQVDTPKPELAVGRRVAADAIFLAEQLTARTALTVGANPTAFEWAADGGLLMRTDRGWNVRLGTSDDLDYKLVVWRAILDRAGIEKFSATHADIRFPTRPFVRSRT